MKRAGRIIRFAALSLLGGAAVSVAVAEGIAVSGAVDFSKPTRLWLIQPHGQHVKAYETLGPGWRYFNWGPSNAASSALLQRIRGRSPRPARGDPPPAFTPDPPGSLPPWASVWEWSRRREEAGAAAAPDYDEHVDVGVGWPFLAASVSFTQSSPPEVHGGTQLRSRLTGRLSLLIWRPVMPGLAADTLVYAAALAALAGGARLVVRARRKRRRACLACGYDLRGLAAGAGCPECGRADRASAARTSAVRVGSAAPRL